MLEAGDKKDTVVLELVKEKKDFVYQTKVSQKLLLIEKVGVTNQTITHSTKVTLAPSSQLVYFLILFGGMKVNKKITIELKGESSEAKILGVYVGKKNQDYHFQVTSLHSGSNTRALTWINGILTEQSVSNFDGLVKILPGLHQVNSYLANHVLVLGNEAQANAVPSLEIESNDVKCSHEATVGQIDQEYVFYLQSRGLTLKQAKEILIKGFFESVITKIGDKQTEEFISRSIQY